MGESCGVVVEYVVDGRFERIGGVVTAHGHVLVLDVAPERLIAPNLTHLHLYHSNNDTTVSSRFTSSGVVRAGPASDRGPAHACVLQGRGHSTPGCAPGRRG